MLFTYLDAVRNPTRYVNTEILCISNIIEVNYTCSLNVFYCISNIVVFRINVFILCIVLYFVLSFEVSFLCNIKML